MSLIERYIFRQALRPVLGAVLALGVIALISQSLTVLSDVIKYGQNPLMALQLTVLVIPQTLSLIAPLAVFVGVLIAINRLHLEQEIVVCFAGGVSRWRVIAPIMKLACTMAVAILFINLFIQPLSFRAMRQVTYEMRTDFAATLVKEGEFTQTTSGLAIYAQKVEQSGLLRGVFIKLPTSSGETTYSAAEGRILSDNGKPSLILRRGSSQSYNSQGVLNYIRFDEYPLDLSSDVDNDEYIAYKSSDRWLHELIFPNRFWDWEQHNVKKMLAEAHLRLSSPLYIPAVAALALFGVLAGGFSRNGYGARIAMVIGIFAIVRILGFGVEAMCERNASLNILQYLLPLAVTFWALKGVFREGRAKKRSLEFVPLSAGPGVAA